MVSGLGGMTYEERCKELGLETLEKRRKIQDMVETFRILCCPNDGNADGMQTTVGERRGPARARTRQAANHLNLQHKYARTEVRRNSFSFMVMDPWNRLYQDTRSASNVKLF